LNSKEVKKLHLNRKALIAVESVTLDGETQVVKLYQSTAVLELVGYPLIKEEREEVKTKFVIYSLSNDRLDKMPAV
jgi:hypothetical protein